MFYVYLHTHERRVVRDTRRAPHGSLHWAFQTEGVPYALFLFSSWYIYIYIYIHVLLLLFLPGKCIHIYSDFSSLFLFQGNSKRRQDAGGKHSMHVFVFTSSVCT
jgi:hypothetical protein